MAVDDRAALMATLSPGQAHDGMAGRKLLTLRGAQEQPAYLLMARAYAGDAARQLARDLGYWPVVPPRCHRKVKGEYDRELYRRRNEVERFFRPAEAAVSAGFHPLRQVGSEVSGLCLAGVQL